MVASRFDALDALRGVAAVAVLFLHVGEPWIAPHGYLAVDFFFGLSGFVIASAYEEKLRSGTLSFISFTKLRVIRLYPMIILGSIIGAIAFYKVYGIYELWIDAFFGALLVPSPYAMSSEDLNAFPLNPPSWSLLAELLGNLIYAAALPLLGKRSPFALISISGLALIFLGYKYNGLDIGWKINEIHFGIPRFCFSFLIGVWLFRLRSKYIKYFRSFPLQFIILILALTFIIPKFNNFNWVTDIIIVCLAFPLIIALGASATSRQSRLCRIIGELSYPTYVLQGGIVQHLRAISGHFGISGVKSLLLASVMIAMYLAFCWIILKVVDEPIRKRLLGNGLRKQAAPAQTAP